MAEKTALAPTSIWAELSNLIHGIPREDQMVLPWARIVRPGSAAREVYMPAPLPEAYQPLYDAILRTAPGAQAYTVLFPAYSGPWDRARERVVIVLGGDIHVLENDGGQVRAITYPAGCINRVETGIVLLYTWLQLHGRTSDGNLATTELKFNTVTDYVVAPVISRARLVPAGSENAPRDWDKFDPLGHLNLKLRNYSRRGVAPGTQVIAYVYQPEIRVVAHRLLGLTLYKPAAVPHMLILTDRELILIDDGTSRRFGRLITNGGIWDYIPLDKIVSLSVTRSQGDLLNLTIALPGDDSLTCVFSEDNRPQVEALLRQLETVTTRQLRAAGR